VNVWSVLQSRYSSYLPGANLELTAGADVRLMQPGEQIGMEAVDFQEYKHLIVPSLQRMRTGNYMSSKPFAFVHVNIIPMDEECVLGDQTVWEEG